MKNTPGTEVPGVRSFYLTRGPIGSLPASDLEVRLGLGVAEAEVDQAALPETGQDATLRELDPVDDLVVAADHVVQGTTVLRRCGRAHPEIAVEIAECRLLSERRAVVGEFAGGHHVHVGDAEAAAGATRAATAGATAARATALSAAAWTATSASRATSADLVRP